MSESKFKYIPFPSIDRFDTLYSTISRRFSYIGKDLNGDPMYDYNNPKPTLDFKGTVKLHGTNAGVSFYKGSIWAQSRTRVIKIVDSLLDIEDNYNFGSFVQDKKDIFLSLFTQVKNAYSISDDSVISIYGEWAGKGILGSTAISNLERSLYIFGLRVTDVDQDFSDPRSQDVGWLSPEYIQEIPDHRIYNISNKNVHTVSINFNSPSEALKEIEQKVDEVATKCPIAAGLGVEGAGEGIVYSCIYKGSLYLFKAKSPKFAETKTKTAVPICYEKVESQREFADKVVTQARVEHAIVEVFGSSPLDRNKTGDIIRWILQDIAKEEQGILQESGLTLKECSSAIACKTKALFFGLIESSIL